MKELINLDLLDTCACSLRAGIKIRAEPVQVALIKRSNMSRRFHHPDSVSPGTLSFFMVVYLPWPSGSPNPILSYDPYPAPTSARFFSPTLYSGFPAGGLKPFSTSEVASDVHPVGYASAAELQSHRQILALGLTERLAFYSKCKSFPMKYMTNDKKANKSRLTGYECALPESGYQISFISIGELMPEEMRSAFSPFRQRVSRDHLAS